MYKTIPLYDFKIGVWSERTFDTRELYVEYLWSLFKKPGKYEYDESSVLFNEQARYFNKHGVFCLHSPNSKDYITYWDDQKNKCRNGIIVQNGKKEWFIQRDFYFLLNFLKIYNKEKQNFTFIDLRDAQYHMALYEEIAEHSFKHAAILKKRQILSSYFHVAKLADRFWFEAGSINKLAGSLGTYIKDDWRFLEEYRNFLNTNTAWYRPCTPDKLLDWEQKIEITQNGKKRDIGLKSVMKGLILDKDPSAGCGGPVSLFFFDESGIAPKLNQTLEFLLPALKSGMIYTGMFITAGSVGDLSDCAPLEDLIRRPRSKDVLAVTTDLLDDKGTIAECGLFIPEQWSMQPCIDKWGNSLVEEALEMILEERKQWKKDLTPADYQLRISQKPTTIEEAFAYREESPYPMHLITKQMERINNGEYFLENVDLKRDGNGKILIESSRKSPILEFPISANLQNKEGIIVMHERPTEGAKFGTYYASLDPVNAGVTISSNSLASIYIYKNAVEVTLVKEDGTTEHRVEPDKLVCWWTGRFDDLDKTHERLEMMLELYNAWCIVENNITAFIQHMQKKNKQRYLVPKNQLVFLKDIGANINVFQEYGWRNVGRIFKDNIMPKGIEFLSEELDHETKSDGTIVKTYYGIERIPDIMLLKEMMAYQEGKNFDRLIAYSALAAFIIVQSANRGVMREKKYENKNLDISKKSGNLHVSPFKSIGTKGSGSNKHIVQRSGFKNLK